MTTKKAEITPRAAKARYVELALAAGICTHCLKAPAREERVTCGECSRKGTEYVQRSRAGLSRPQRSLGELTQAQVAEQRRTAAVAAGRCSICCSRRARKDLWTCRKCGDRAKTYRTAKPTE